MTSQRREEEGTRDGDLVLGLEGLESRSGGGARDDGRREDGGTWEVAVWTRGACGPSERLTVAHPPAGIRVRGELPREDICADESIVCFSHACNSRSLQYRNPGVFVL